MDIKQNTGRTRLFLMVASSDHITGATGLTVTVTVSKAGGAFATPGGTVAEVGLGWYRIALTTTDTNTMGDLTYHATATGADPNDWQDQVVAYDAQDSVGLGLARLDANVGGVAAAVWAFASRTLSAFGIPVTVSTNNDKSGYVLASQPPTAAQISTQVWSEPVPGTFAAGTSGSRLNSAASAGDPWATNLPGAYGTGTAGNIVGTRLDAKVSSVVGGTSSGGVVGPGSIQKQITATYPDNVTPIEGVAVWVSTDVTGNNVVAGTLYTDELGHATFMLDAGTYYLWQQKGGFNFTNPATLVVP